MCCKDNTYSGTDKENQKKKWKNQFSLIPKHETPIARLQLQAPGALTSVFNTYSTNSQSVKRQVINSPS